MDKFEITTKMLNECAEVMKVSNEWNKENAAELAYWCEQYIRDYELYKDVPY